MSENAKIEALEVYLEKILSDYLELAEVVNELRAVRNLKKLCKGDFVFTHSLLEHLSTFQKQLTKLNYHSIQIEKELDEIEQS